MFTIDHDSGSDSLIIINSTWGLGENIVGGNINPDEFSVFKSTLNLHQPILKRTLGSIVKTWKLVVELENAPQ
jgi:pyruvate,water dikinase